MKHPPTPNGAVPLLVTVVVIVGEIVLAAAQHWGMAIAVAIIFALASLSFFANRARRRGW